MKLPYTEVKFYPEVKSQTGLSSLRVSCKRALNQHKITVALKQTLPNVYTSLVESISNYVFKEEKKSDLDSSKTEAITKRCSTK